MSQDPWDKLEGELKLWAGDGAPATFWWRDDDAAQPTPPLTQLTQLAQDYEIPLALAIIPAQTGTELQHQLRGVSFVTAVQHGHAHLNHAGPDEKKCEFPVSRSADLLRQDLADGQRIMANFDNRLSLFVPPWNRLDERHLPLLVELGFTGISQFGAATSHEPQPGLRQLNTHVDVIAWKTTRGFVGQRRALNAICDHLVQRRLGQIRSDEPTGLLTHHLVHDQETWTFMSRLFHFSKNCSTMKWLSAGEALPGEALQRVTNAARHKVSQE